MTFAELPGWTFEVREVSAGVYRLTARDRDGRLIEASGEDPDALLAEAKATATRLDAGRATTGQR